MQVFTKGDHEAGPDYALIETCGDVQALLAPKVTATNALAEQFGDGPLFSTEWRLRSTPFVVTWLMYDAFLDENKDEPAWMSDLYDDNEVEPPDDWRPNIGGNDSFGRPKNQYTFVELETVKIFPLQGMNNEVLIQIEGLADGEFGTGEFSADYFSK